MSKPARETVPARPRPGRDLHPPRPPLGVVAVATVVLALVVADIRLSGPLDHLDHRIGSRVNTWDLRNHDLWRHVLTVGLYFGQRGVVLPLALILAAWLAWRNRTSEPLLRLVVAGVSLAVVVYGFKLGLARNAPIQDAHGVPAGRGASFPSGHMANAILLWGLAYWSVLRWNSPFRLGQVINVGRFVAPVAILVSMTLLNYHWLSDFVGGAAVGVILLGLALLPVWTSACSWIDVRWFRPRSTSRQKSNR
jgi:membrane-associated phospholipid phosphatase